MGLIMAKDPMRAMQSGARSKISGDKYDYTYYDTAVLAAATRSHRMFTQSLGGTKTLADTNMKIGGQVANGKKLVVRCIKFTYVAKAQKATAFLQQYYDFLDQSTIQILLDGKEDQGTYRLTEMMGASEYISVVPTVPGDNLHQNQSVVNGILKLNEKIVLPALQVFEILLVHHTATNAALDDDRFVIGLNGKLKSLN